MMGDEPRTVFILGLTSDIGRELGRRYLAQGWAVAGTYRRTTAPDVSLNAQKLFQCDVTDSDSVRRMAASCALTVCAMRNAP